MWGGGGVEPGAGWDRGGGISGAAGRGGRGGDAPLLVGIALVSAAIVFGGNLMANVLYGVIDPRIRKGASHAV